MLINVHLPSEAEFPINYIFVKFSKIKYNIVKKCFKAGGCKQKMWRLISKKLSGITIGYSVKTSGATQMAHPLR
jgi:hypothetical protein